MTQGPGLAVVTGATSAIGGAVAEMLAGLGHDLALFGRSGERLAQAASRCGSRGRPAATFAFDLADREATAQAVSRLRADAGEPRILVHCAGLFDWANAEAADLGAWEALMAVNVGAVMRLTHLLIPSLIRHSGSAIVFIASGAGHQGFANNAAYVASKHAVVGFGRALFQDLRDRGVKVSTVSPGLVAAGASLTLDERLHERFLRPEDVAEAVRYVLAAAPSACPTEIRLEPQRTPM